MELKTHLKRIAKARWAKIPKKKRSEIMKRVRKGRENKNQK